MQESVTQMRSATVPTVKDLNSQQVGSCVMFHAGSMQNIPCGTGLCITYGYLLSGNSWVWQLALDTNTNNIFIRRKINAAAWTTWYAIN